MHIRPSVLLARGVGACICGEFGFRLYHTATTVFGHSTFTHLREPTDTF